MEARIGSGGGGGFYAAASTGNKKAAEWDLNNWRWDGELFTAVPLNAAAAAPLPDARSKLVGLSNSSSVSYSEEADFGATGKVGTEKRRWAEDEVGPPLTLKLGGHTHDEPELDGGSGAKRGKVRRGSFNGGTGCQVQGCGADLSGAKDYHRRHKVCEMHAKASRAVVGNVMQRFCQQCSRFHLLQEFDEGKRSCRRRLAGHNRRRRKTHPDATADGITLTDDQSSSYLLITLLKILTNLHSSGSDQSKDQDLLSHLLRNITSIAGSSDANNLSRILQIFQDTQNLGNSAGTSSEAANPLLLNGVAGQGSARTLFLPSNLTSITGPQGPSMRPIDNSVPIAVDRVKETNLVEDSLGETVQAIPSKKSAAAASDGVVTAGTEAVCSLQHMLPAESPIKRVRLNDFDLNDTYNDAQDLIEGCQQSLIPQAVETGSPDCPSWMVQDSHKSSPPQTSGNSDSTSALSLSNSNGDTQSRTDRIIFKLFGKDPNDVPLSLRGQVLDWLSHSPTDMESYIRPGCVILTIYLRLSESGWEELSRDLTSSLNRLLHLPGDDFWGKGWIFASIQHHIAFAYNGHVVLDSPLLLKGLDYRNILSITPIAVPLSARVNFKVKGFNLARPTTRLLCAFEGRYMVPETPQPLVEETEEEYDGPQCCSFYCSLPNALGRGFIEVEDNGLNGGFFPFVVAEEDVCSDIRTLESTIEEDPWNEKSDMMYARNQAIDFLHEIGWLLRRSHLRSRSEEMNSWPNVFPLTRFRWLMSFAMDREWCAVVKKLLDILFLGNIDLGGRSPVEITLSEELLHRAVRKKCELMVEVLLGYTPHTTANETGPDRFLFKPDALGSGNLTPLHIAASVTGAEGVLDALTDDPGQLGIKAWSNLRDVTGFTPEDYARARGFDSYIDLVHNKIKKNPEKVQVVLDIPGSFDSGGATHKHLDIPSPSKLTGFQIERSKLSSLQQRYCRLCDEQLMHRSYGRRSMLHRPVMLSMVGIAAVCVCVGLLLKGPPEVLFTKTPFRWETLAYGWM